MTEFLDRNDVLTVGSIACGFRLELRDYGLLDSAVARPRSVVFGVDTYPDLFTKAAALMQSLVCNRPLLDGNTRTAWGSALSFLYINGISPSKPLDVDAAESLVVDLATRDQPVDGIATLLMQLL